MASGISSTRQAATRICLCELVGLDGPAQPLQLTRCCSFYLLCAVGDTFRLLFIFLSLFFIYLFPPPFTSVLLLRVVVGRCGCCCRPNHRQSELRPVAARLIPLFFILRFQQTAPTHGAGLAWRLRMMLPHLLSFKSC